MKVLALLTVTEVRNLRRLLLAWFEEHKRNLPWRMQRNPYRVWVSEVMLQQTQVTTVIPYFERWMKQYPSVAALASAREADVLKAWEGLGYYSRARNLMRGANHVLTAHGGQFPDSVEELRRVPGIGRYTAGAIASIAFGHPAPVLDGNVMRVLCRVRDLAGDPRKAPLHEHLWSLAEQLATGADSGSLNESLMELGALVCTPKNPQCALCPLRRQCLALKCGSVEQRPEMARSKGATRREVHILLVRQGRSRVLVQEREPKSTHWANLWAFPYVEITSPDTRYAAARAWAKAQLGRDATNVTAVTEGKYAITRFRFEYTALALDVSVNPKKKLPSGYAWVEHAQLHELAMPAPHRKLVKQIT